MWTSGDRIIYREVTHGKVWTVRPVTVINDTPDLIALYMRNLTPWKVCVPLNADTDLLQCKANLRQWKLDDVIWSYGDTIFLIYPERAHAVHVMWNHQREFEGWYVNLQEPPRRTSLGFDFLDQELDIIVSPGLEWQWKDISHLERAQNIGLFSSKQVEAIMCEGQSVVAGILAKAAPFDGSWNNWKPLSTWPTPGLPERWDRIG
jgi:hypothetical protein